MPRIRLLGGAYSSASLIASAQRSINLYPETNPEESQAPVNVTHFQRPGLLRLSSPPSPGIARGLYTATDGTLYAVLNQTVYRIGFDYRWSVVGSLLASGTTPVYIADNGSNAIVVDGSLNGYSIDMSTFVMSTIGDPNFLGADRVDFIDSFLVLNQPGTPNWYSSDSNAITFNALAFGTKTAWPDNIVALITVEREVWLFGPYKSEISYNAGASPFPFATLPGVIIEHGCAAKYSVAKQDVNVYWLSQSPEGARMAMRGNQHSAQRISNHAVEAEWLTYARVDDAIGSVYQVRGHAFYKLHFPTVDKTWGFDEATKQWHEDLFMDVNGVLHRALNTYCAYAYGLNVAIDRRNGDLYQISESTFTDAGSAIYYERGMPHLIGDDDERQTVRRFIADIEAGETDVASPMISLSISRDRGGSYDNPRLLPAGSIGEYATRPTWWNCGYGADFVFKLHWSSAAKTSLNGAFAIVERHMDDVFE